MATTAEAVEGQQHAPRNKVPRSSTRNQGDQEAAHTLSLDNDHREGTGEPPYQQVSVSVSLCRSVSLSLCVSVALSLCLSLCLCLSLSLCDLSLRLCASVCDYVTACFRVCMSACLLDCLSVCLCLCVCVYVWVSAARRYPSESEGDSEFVIELGLNLKGD